MTRTTLLPPHLRRQLQALTALSFKQASIGGEPEQGFEQSFSTLAYSFLKDKAPRLLDYVVGFQLLDRNNDNTRAVGVFGAKVGKQWLYVPIFFLSGEIKGHELLYLKDRDLFVPLKENWIDYILNHKPHSLGEPSRDKAKDLGALQPDLRRMAWPPNMSKYSVDREAPWAGSFLEVCAEAQLRPQSFLRKHAAETTALDLEPVLKRSPGMGMACWRLTQRHPGIKGAFDRFYPGLWPKLASTYRVQREKERWSIMPVKKAEAFELSLLPKAETHPMKTGALRLYVFDSMMHSNMPGSLGDKDKKDLARDGYLLKDYRTGERVSTAYRPQITMELRNPSETGIYEVLEKPGSFQRMLVIHAPQSHAGREGFVTVIRLEGKKEWANLERHSVWVREQGPESPVQFKEWFDKLDKGSLETGGRYVAVMANGQGTVPFKVREKLDDDTYEVDTDSHSSGISDQLISIPKTHDRSLSFGRCCSGYDVKLHTKRPDGSSLRCASGEMFIPENAKFLRLAKSKYDWDGDGEPHEPIQPGNIIDVQTLLTEKTARLKLMHDVSEFIVEPADGIQERLNKRAALIRLVCQHGLREKAARAMLDEVERKGAVTYRIKYADGHITNGSNLQPGPGAGNFPEPSYMSPGNPGPNYAPWQFPQEDYQPVPEMNAALQDPYRYDPYNMPDPYAQQVAQEAGQEGQKEVFDTAMLSGLLKNVSNETMIDRHLSALMRAIDRLGRLLFSCYWHSERWQDRYGKQDMVEIEEAMRNAFETLGDVTLTLKEKTVDPNLEHLGDLSVEHAAEM